jgi:Zn-dependent membrane protease YugP
MNLSTYSLLIGVPLIFGLWAQYRVSSAFSRYKKIAVASGLTGVQAAEQILRAERIDDVSIVAIDSMMGDHYDPSKKCLNLSTDVYYGNSISAVGVAAHECGHAIQHKEHYSPLQWRSALVPITQFSSQLLPFLLLGGLFFHFVNLINFGIACYGVLTVFQLITLPVEFDASARAKRVLQKIGIIHAPAEVKGVAAVLDAAALTYIAAFIAAIANMIYLLMLRRDSR